MDDDKSVEQIKGVKNKPAKKSDTGIIKEHVWDYIRPVKADDWKSILKRDLGTGSVGPNESGAKEGKDRPSTGCFKCGI